jgi:hypothetical protein
MVRFLGLISIGLQPTSDFQTICEADLQSAPNISALIDLFARPHWTVASSTKGRCTAGLIARSLGTAGTQAPLFNQQNKGKTTTERAPQ